MLGVCCKNNTFPAGPQCSSETLQQLDKEGSDNDTLRKEAESKLHLRFCCDSGPVTPDSSEPVEPQWRQIDCSPKWDVVANEHSDLIPLLSSHTNEIDICALSNGMLTSNYDRASTWNSTNPYATSSPSYASSTSSAQTNFYVQSSYPSKLQQQNLHSLTTLSLPGKTPSLYATGYAPRPEYSYGPGVCPSSANADVFAPRTSNGSYSYPTYSTPYSIKSPYDPTTISDPYGSYYSNSQSWPPTMTNPYSSGYVGTDNSSISGRRRRGNLPKHITDILRAWFHEHLDHPYPTDEDKQMFIDRTGLTISQISNWFINARRRHWPALKAQRLPRTATHSSRQSTASVS